MKWNIQTFYNSTIKWWNWIFRIVNWNLFNFQRQSFFFSLLLLLLSVFGVFVAILQHLCRLLCLLKFIRIHSFNSNFFYGSFRNKNRCYHLFMMTQTQSYRTNTKRKIYEALVYIVMIYFVEYNSLSLALI